MVKRFVVGALILAVAGTYLVGIGRLNVLEHLAGVAHAAVVAALPAPTPAP